MANIYSVNSLVGLIRTRTNLQNSPTFDDNVELKPWVRDSLKQLYEIQCQRSVDWFTVKRPLTILTNVERYTMPADCRNVHAVYMAYSSGSFKIPMRSFSRDSYGRYGSEFSINSLPQYVFQWRYMGNKLWLSPTPTQDFVNSIEFHYTPQWSGPLLDWTTIDDHLPNGFEEWAVLDVIQKMNVKLNRDNSQIVNQKQEALQRLIAGTSIRTGEAPMMRDIYAYPRYNYYSGYPGGPQTWAGE